MTTTTRVATRPEQRQEDPVRPRLAAVGLALGVLGLAVVNVLSPWGRGADQVSTLRTEGELLTVLSVLWFCSAALLVGGAAGVVGRVRGRGRTLALAGGVVAGAATICSAVVGAVEGMGPALANAIPDDRELAAALVAFDTSPVLYVVFVGWLLGSVIGWPLLVLGAGRAGLLSRWFALPVGVAWVGNLVSTGPIMTAILVVAFAVPMLVLAWGLATRIPG